MLVAVKFSQMKDFLKFVAFLEFIVVILFGCLWLVFEFIAKENVPIIVLPITMVVVLGAILLSMIIQPIADWWMS